AGGCCQGAWSLATKSLRPPQLQAGRLLCRAVDEPIDGTRPGCGDRDSPEASIAENWPHQRRRGLRVGVRTSSVTKNKKSKAERKLRIKEAWFDSGTAAFERVFPGSRARAFPELHNPYVCPLCRRPFVREGLASGTLTFEDAPPKSYGGDAVALTCKPCNNSKGSSVDASLARYDSQFVSPCTIEIGGVQVNAYQEIQSGGRHFSIPQNQNDPKAVERFNAILETKDPAAWPKLPL